MEIAETPQEVHLTAWHVFLVELIRYFSDPARVEVQDFVKLGTLPLEADVILLRKKEGGGSGGAAQLMTEDLAFLEPRLRDLTVLEYKSPVDPLRWTGVDRARVYGLLAKEKYQIEWDRRVSVVMLYSQVQRRLFESLAEGGLVFEKEEEGIRVCRGSMMLYAVDLVALGRRQPCSPLNLVSARHEEYTHEAGLSRSGLALVQRIQYLIRQGKVRGMALDKLPGYEELARDEEALVRRFLEGLTPEQRLNGMTPDQRIAGMTPEEMDKLLTLLESLRKKPG